MSTFDGSSTTKAWVSKLEAFFLIHPVVEKEAVEISALHLGGEAHIWWFNHLSHARVSTLAEFSQKLIKKFDRRRSGKEESSPPLEESWTNTITLMEEQPHTSVVGAANTFEDGTLATLQEIPKSHQGMKIFPLSIIAAKPFESCGNFLLYDQGSNHTADLE